MLQIVEQPGFYGGSPIHFGVQLLFETGCGLGAQAGLHLLQRGLGFSELFFCLLA